MAPSKKLRTSKVPVQSSSVSAQVSTKPITVDGDDKETAESVAWWDALFADRPDDFLIQLVRMSPTQMEGYDGSLAGYLCEMEPVAGSNYEGWIQARYGGGVYRIIKKRRDTHQFVTSKTVSISGRPLLPVSPNAPRPSENTRERSVLTIDGTDIDISQDTRDLVPLLAKLKAVKDFFREPDPPPMPELELVKMLLPMLLQRGGSNDDMMDRALAMMERIDNVAAKRAPTGDGWEGILKEGIHQAGEVLTAAIGKESANTRASSRKILGRQSAAKQLPAPESANPNIDEDTMAKQPPTPRQIAEIACQCIAEAFTFEPRKSAAEAVKLIDFTIGALDKSIIEKVEPWKSTLEIMAWATVKTQIPEDEPTTELQADFTTYFDAVFALWTDTSREVPSL